MTLEQHLDYQRSRVEAASNPATPRSRLTHFAHEPDPLVRTAVATNPSCPDKALGILAEDPEGYVQAAAAANPNCPPAALERLALGSDDEYGQAAAAAGNPSCPPKAVAALAVDSDNPVIARAAARNPSCPSEVLERFARSADPVERRRAAYNPACPPETLTQLTEDPDSNVRRETAGNPNTTEDMLRQLANDENDLVRAVVAENPNCPRDVLAALERDPCPMAFEAVANHPSTEPGLLGRCAESDDWRVRRNVAFHAAGNPEMQRSLSCDPEAEVRLAVLSDRSSDFPPGVLEQMAFDVHYEVRESVAGHLATPRQVLLRLLRDPDRRVVWAAAEHLVEDVAWAVTRRVRGALSAARSLTLQRRGPVSGEPSSVSASRRDPLTV